MKYRESYGLPLLLYGIMQKRRGSMGYTKEQVLDAYLARLVLEDGETPGDVEAIWRRRQAAVGGVRSGESLSDWEARFKQGCSILGEARLVVSRPFAKNAEIVLIPRSNDSPAVSIDDGCQDGQPMMRYAVLVAGDR
jgi:hypothetical protein